MGRDYRHRGTKIERFEDGYGAFKNRKLDSYDRNKNRKQNKIDINHFDVAPDFDVEIEDEVSIEEEENHAS